MPEIKFTKIWGRKVPVVIQGGLSEVHFDGGAHGKGVEKGWFCFWTAIGVDELGDWKVFGRSFNHLPAGNRFRRFEAEQHTAKSVQDRRAYRRLHGLMRYIQCIRPSQPREIRMWMNGHRSDAEWYSDHVVIEGWEYDRVPRLWPGMPKTYYGLAITFDGKKVGK